MSRALALALILLALLTGAIGAAIYTAGHGWFGRHEGPGAVTQRPLSPELLATRARAQRSAAEARGVESPKQILFGDLHVHTTFSVDAFVLSLPAVQGEGAHPPADACDFARYCSALDFWSINDHAEGLTPQRWRETVESIRQCNAVAGDPQSPDVVAFLGWEWTQVGPTPETHYGHKNVVLAHTDEDRIPRRPIASRSLTSRAARAVPTAARGTLALLSRNQRTHDMMRFLEEILEVRDCPKGVDVRALPDDCFEAVETAGGLFRKLDEWGHEAIVIPHGTTWGFYTPPGSSWDQQLSAAEHDPERQRLIEVFSGHGNSEEYRDWRAVRFDEGGGPVCPSPTKDYLPSCWLAGEFIRERCRAANRSDVDCEWRATVARRQAAEAFVAGHLTVPGVEPAEWLDAGQCRDCFLPAFNYRPASSVQYILALRKLANPSHVQRFDFGFIASSDIHSGRPGTGYKEVNRREMTEAAGPASPVLERVLRRRGERAPRSVPRPAAADEELFFNLIETERQSSFFLTGGLVAVHAEGRSRWAIWEALERREVYGTSGPRILLWFDLLNDPRAPDGMLAMGGETALPRAPEFLVRAVGSLEQEPGCPEEAAVGLGPDRLHHLCRGECYHPSEERRIITRIEVVRIHPQDRPDEPIGDLIEDPWLSFPCRPDPSGCVVYFSDPDFEPLGRDTLYYVRAIEAPSLAVNAGNLRCEGDGDACVRVDPCWGDYRVPYEDDCLAEIEERAWSSPIFVTFDETADFSAPEAVSR